MTIYEHQLRHAPGGMNSVLDRPQIPPSRSAYIRGFLPARYGALEAAHPVMPLPALVQTGQNDSITGMAFFAGTANAPDATEISHLIVVRGGLQVYAHQVFRPIYGSANYPSATALPGVYLGNLQYGGDLYASQYIRSVQYQGELFLVQDGGGSPPMRITREGTLLKLYPCGIARPTAAQFSLADGGAGSLPAATYDYRLTWADEKFRESSPSATRSITLGASKKMTVTIPWSQVEEQVKVAYLYRAAQGTSDYYRVTPSGSATDYIPRGTATGTDNTTEALLVVGTLSPRPGENDPPEKASMIAVHKNRLVLNKATVRTNPTDLESLDTIQISNSNAPTQFSTVGTLDYPSDGASFVVGSDRGDLVTGIHSYGSLLLVFKRQTTFALYGEDLTTWEMRHLFHRGCVAGSTIVEADGTLCFLAIDGLYQLAGENAPRKISDEIDNYFTGFAFKSE